jgi:hypothetical protein
MDYLPLLDSDLADRSGLSLCRAERNLACTVTSEALEEGE